MLSCTRDNLNIIKYLIANGSDIYIRNKDGWNAFHIAVRYVLEKNHCLCQSKYS